MPQSALDAADQIRLHDWIERTRQEAPHIAPILDSCGAVLAERAALRAQMRGKAPQIPVPGKDRLASGAPALLDADLAGLAPFLGWCASRMVPVMAHAFPALAPDLERLVEALAAGSLAPVAALEALLRGDGAALEGMAREAGLAEPVLRFALAQIVRPVLECAQETLARAVRDAKWLRGRCPSCGSAPDLALFTKGEEESSEFIRNHGGQRWMRCSLCGMSWRFKRMACPECGTEEPGDLECFAIEGRDHERAHACSKCRRYMVGIDVRELVEVPDLDVAALAMLPLDILVQDKGFAPVAVTPWNTLG
ncbi:MAG: formate dehydrogenase accessory protein FdhE [Thermodesulfobacteriota bacterium]